MLSEYLLESSMIGFFGGLIGMLLGLLTVYLLNSATESNQVTVFTVTTTVIVGPVVFAMVLGTLAGLFPALPGRTAQAHRRPEGGLTEMIHDTRHSRRYTSAAEIRGQGGHDVAIDSRASSCPSWGRRAPARPPCCTCSACWTPRPRGQHLHRRHGHGRLSAKELTRLRREKIGFVFQEFNLLPVLNAAENVELPLRYQGAEPQERHRRAMEALEWWGWRTREQPPPQLSGESSSGWPSPAPWSPTRCWCWRTSPPASSTPQYLQGHRAHARYQRRAGQTFAIVTHDPMVADYTRRIVTLRDGKVSPTWPGPRPWTWMCGAGETV